MEKPISILIVDDEESFGRVLAKELSLSEFKVMTASSGERAEVLMKEREFDVALVDIKMPGMGGLELLERLKQDFPLTEVIILTGHGTMERAIQAIKLGAYDFLMKPCGLDELEAVIQKAYEKKNLAQQNILLKTELARRGRFDELIGKSQEIKGVLELISKVSSTESPILIQGESGVGKELVAGAIHKYSLRKDNPFVIIDCGSLQESLLESELFGYEKGAYTGAMGLKHGLFEVADTGTIFLDEIGEISPAIQVKLLRVIEAGTFRRLGGNKHLQVDVRIISATKRNLLQFVSEGQFREDLFYRLNLITIFIPPLRDRKEDIPLLVDHFLKQASKRGQEKRITGEAMEILLSYSWPGNVRELSNVIERAVILTEEQEIRPEDLPSNLRPSDPFIPRYDSSSPMTIREVEKKYIEMVLEATGGHRSRAAKILDISERSLYRKIRDLGL
jgi:DNA-binding NtrC family response regulator